jgi:hypothetical protein
MNDSTIKVINRFDEEFTILKRNLDNDKRTLLPILNSTGHIIGSIHRDNIQKICSPTIYVAPKPVGKLRKFNGKKELLFVFVTRAGKKRKYVDDVGNVFVKAFGKIWKYPEQVSY